MVLGYKGFLRSNFYIKGKLQINSYTNPFNCDCATEYNFDVSIYDV